MWGILILIILVFVIGILYLRHRARNQALEQMYGHLPNHVELYFVEYFDNIVDNWDLIDKDKAHEWAEGMQARLGSVSNEIQALKNKSTNIDKQLDTVEDRINTMERNVSDEEII